MSEQEHTASDRMGRRISGGRARAWVLMEGDRWLVAGALLAGLFGVLVALGAADPVGLRQSVRVSDPVETVFQALLTAIITGVTLVVTINQLVLSQELGAVGDQRERMEGSMQFRRDVEDVLGEPVSPPEPASFLRALVEAVGDRAGSLEDELEAQGQAHEEVETFVRELRENARTVGERLADAEFGTFEVLSAALNFNYSRKIYEARRLQGAHAGALSDPVLAGLDEVVWALELFAPAREHVKTLYFQWELIDLSRAVLYAAGPALAVSLAMVLYVDTPGAVPGAVLGVDYLVWLVAAATTVAVTPFALLLSYILRIATVAKRTLAIGPFVLRTVDEES